jgi:hypothetical protein
MDEDDIDDELALSLEIAATIKSLAEKKELLIYKRNHTEVGYLLFISICRTIPR